MTFLSLFSTSVKPFDAPFTRIERVQRHRPATKLALVLSLLSALAGCKRSDSAPSPIGAASATLTSANTCDSFVKKVVHDEKKASDPEQQAVFREVCEAVSPQARACVLNAKSPTEVDKCIEPEMEKVMAIALKRANAAAQAGGSTSATKIAKLGVELDMPGESMVSDGITDSSQMVSSAATGTLIVSEVSPDHKQTLKVSKSNAKELYSGKNIKEGTVPGGYWLTFENKGSLGANYYAEAQIEVGKKTYRCEVMASDEAHQTAARDACKTLRAAK